LLLLSLLYSEYFFFVFLSALSLSLALCVNVRLISIELWLVSKAIFALRMSMVVYMLRKKNKKKKKEERNPLGMRRQPSRNREKEKKKKRRRRRRRRNNLCNNLSFSVSLLFCLIVVVVELPLIMGNWQSTVSSSSLDTTKRDSKTTHLSFFFSLRLLRLILACRRYFL